MLYNKIIGVLNSIADRRVAARSGFCGYAFSFVFSVVFLFLIVVLLPLLILIWLLEKCINQLSE